MLFKKLPVQELNPAPYNPRLSLKPGDPIWKKLERSLAEFDLVQPIVWNSRTGHVVSGHQRLQVMKHHGETEIDCVVVELSLEKEKALNITLNNSSVASDWDPGKLVDLVAELQDLPDFDATLTGFDDQQLQDLIFAPVPLPAEPELENSGNSSHVHVTLEIPLEDWTAAQSQLDDLLAEFPEMRLHVGKVPQS